MQVETDRRLKRLDFRRNEFNVKRSEKGLPTIGTAEFVDLKKIRRRKQENGELGSIRKEKKRKKVQHKDQVMESSTTMQQSSEET